MNPLFTLTTAAADYGLPIQRSLLPPVLRCYQLKMLTDALSLMRQGYRRILIQAPTGAGKTVLAAALLGGVMQLGLTGEFIVHRKELIKQTSASFDKSGLSHGFVASGFPMDLDSAVILAGVQTLVNRLGLMIPPNLAVVDECHHATSATWASVLESYAGAYIIGLTATPERLDGRGLNEQFDAMVKGPSVAWLIENCFLSPYELFAPAIPDMSAVNEVAGEYNRKRTGEIMGQSKVVGGIVEHYLRLAPGEQGIVFAPTREVSQKYADAFRAHGIAAMHVDGDTDDKVRDRFDDAFRAGDIRIGCNVDLFGEGYDVPNISYVGDAAPSKSRIKVTQRWGRPLRPTYATGFDLECLDGRLAAIMASNKQRAIIADHAGNALPALFGGQGHGLPDDDYEYSMEGRERVARAAVSDATPITQCPKCFLVYPSSSSHCPRCETAAPPLPRVVRETEGKLSKVEREELKRAAAVRRKQEERECENFDQFYSLGRARGYEFPRQWAVRQCKMRRISTSSERIM